MLSRHDTFDRRLLLRGMGAGLLASTSCRWLPALAAEVAADPRRRRQCILLWMSGGPSQTDTFDMKPGHANGGEFKELQTRVPGLRFSEHLPKLADHADKIAIIRSLSTKEGDHSRGAHLVRTGHPPMGDVAYPSLSCALAKELSAEETPLPSCVCVAPPLEISPAAFGPGFLGQQFAPAIVGRSRGGPPNGAAGPADLRLDDLELPSGVDARQAQRRMELWNALESKFLRDRAAAPLEAHHALYKKAAEMMKPEVRAAFDLAAEADDTRKKYGETMFGQGCLLARRLVERGVPFVEVALNGAGAGWDTHQNNFTQVRQLSQELDAGWSALMAELRERGLLETTTILWMGEFGRTPVINSMSGRDHFPAAWSCVFAGGGIKGGQAYGRTSADGMTVEENKTGIGDVLATLCAALGVAPEHENVTPEDRPIKLAEGTPIHAILA